MSCSSAARRSQRSRTGSKPELLADADGVGRDAGRVAPVYVRLGVDDARERLGHPVEALLVGQRDRGAPAPGRAAPRWRCRTPAAATAGRPGRGQERVREPRVEPGPAPRAHHVDGAPAGRRSVMKTSTVWAMQAMREIERDRLARRGPSGRPLPSQCSSRARTASATAGGKPIIATIRAPRSQRASLSCRRLLRQRPQGAEQRGRADDAATTPAPPRGRRSGRSRPCWSSRLARTPASAGRRRSGTAPPCGRRCSSSPASFRSVA